MAGQNTSFTKEGSSTNTSDPFTYNNQKYNVKIEANVDSSKNVTQSAITLQKQITTRSGPDYKPYATSYDGGKTWYEPGTKPPKILTTSTGLTADEIKALKPEGALNRTVVNAASTTVQKKGEATKEQTKQVQNGNVGTATTADNSAALRSDIETQLTQVNSRNEYGRDLKYPLKLDPNFQDYIKFNIVNYKPPGLSAQGRSTIDRGFRRYSENRSIGTIVLPIPGGINDRNSADWQSDTLGDITRAFAQTAMNTITSGASAGAETAKGNFQDVSPASLEQFISSKFTELATGSSNILSRQYGAVINPNMELLFNGPSLRTFGFTFKMSPREPDEAKMIKKIIRAFKQSMSVKRTESTLLLKAPHTFLISYIHIGNSHKYLNKFKECALTECTVNYAPDGTYMTFNGEPSMTSYELSLTFQELEPIFDDDYTDLDKNNDKDPNYQIGY